MISRLTAQNSPEPTPVSKNPGETSDEVFPAPRQLFFLLAIYFALQIVLRVTFSTSVDLDESEAVVNSQQFSLGYGSDPPLYVWLQMIFFKTFGTSVFTLSLLKNLLLFSTYSLTFATARLLTRNIAASVAAALSVYYLPSIAWESQRDLTHSVVSATLAVATLFCFLKLQETKRLKWYFIFGLCAGFGCISKYNYTLWLFGLVLAGLLVNETRPALLTPRLLISAALALLIFLPNIIWMLNHRDLALVNAGKFEVSQARPWLEATGTGIKNIIQSIISFALPLTLIYTLLFLKRPSRVVCLSQQRPGYRRVLFLAWGIIGAVLVLLVLFAHATGFRERWFQPILVTLPIGAVALVQNRLDAFRLKCIAVLSMLVMLAVALAMPGRLLLAERLKREEPLTRPYTQVAKDLRPVILPGSLVVCDTHLLAGNLRLSLPDVTLLDLDLVPLFSKPYPHCFIAWDARTSDTIPEELRNWLETRKPASSNLAAPHYVSETYRYHSTKKFRVGYVQLY